MGPSRFLPFIGDDDGGRFLHPYGPRDRFGAATLAACGRFHCISRNGSVAKKKIHELAFWWLGPSACPVRNEPAHAHHDSERFADAGIVVMRSGAAHCIVDAGPFGPFRGGHSHADSLSIVANVNGRDLLIDPGTFTYAGNSPWRDRFRGTAAHNTVRIGRLDQAEPAGSFGWRNPPQVEILEWRTDASADFLDADCRYRGFRHRRRVFFLKPELVFVLDDVEGDRIEAEQFWHLRGEVEKTAPGCFRIADAGLLLLNGDAPELSRGGEFGWRSPAYGLKEPGPVIVARRDGGASVQFGAVLAFSVPSGKVGLAVASSGDVVEMFLGGPWNQPVTFPSSGMPRWRVP